MGPISGTPAPAQEGKVSVPAAPDRPTAPKFDLANGNLCHRCA